MGLGNSVMYGVGNEKKKMKKNGLGHGHELSKKCRMNVHNM